MVLGEMAEGQYEQVTHFYDDETGLKAIVAIHDTTLGPSLGGTRLRPYDTEEEARRDVLRLSKGMTYKAAAADLDLGGGKAVIVADPEEKDEALMSAYGRMVDRLDGHYITSVDMNTGVADMDIVAEETDHVVGVSNGLGDPSPVTSWGVFSGLRACVEATYGNDDLSDRTVVVQGVGKVGTGLAEHLVEAGATVKVSDVNDAAVEELVDDIGAEAVAPDDVYSEPCDVFAPCAIGGVVNDETIPQLECDIVAGGANNILENRHHAVDLREEDILYAPDYVINAGGLITVAKEYAGESKDTAFEEAEQIGDRLLEMIELADDRDATVLDAADEYAERRIASRGDVEVTAADD